MAPHSEGPLQHLLVQMPAAEASDLHLVAGYRPMYRVHGELRAAGEQVLTGEQVVEHLRPILPPATLARLESERDIDFAIHIPGPSGSLRFRVNIFTDRSGRGACFRSIPPQIPSLDELGFPVDVAERILKLNNGLVLITGVTGSGKTTSLASLIQMLNERGGYRIITIEQPIEYVYPCAPASIVTQREVGSDVASFYDGLRYGLRQDPDVMLVGEIRDRETAQLAISAAETGHLIFATMHTADAKGAVTRMVDLFPMEMHDDIKSQLSMSLRAIVAQHLLPTGGGRRVLAMETLFATFAVRSAIRQGKIENLDTAIQSGRRDGMFSLDSDLRRLATAGMISMEVARQHAKDPTELGA